MTTIFGLPAHALLVHAIVVLAPLIAALEILCALWPAARRRLVWLVLALAAAVMVLTPLTISAGEWLYDQQAAALSDPARRTRSAAEWMIYFAVGLLVVAIVQAVQHRLESRVDRAQAGAGGGRCACSRSWSACVDDRRRGADRRCRRPGGVGRAGIETGLWSAYSLRVSERPTPTLRGDIT